MEVKRFQKIGGICAIIEALIYVTAFIFYGAILIYPSANASPTEEYDFLLKNYTAQYVMNTLMYVLFGILLAILVVSLHYRFKQKAPILSAVTSSFGIIWVGLVIASGMIANTGLNAMIKIGAEQPEKIEPILSSVNIITEGLGGGNEIVGGIWVLLLSIISLRKKILPNALGYTGIVVGIAGILTMYPLEVFAEIFGITQVFWYLWIGIFMIGNPAIDTTLKEETFINKEV